MATKRIFCLASLYEPLEFLENRIANFNQCDLSEAVVCFVDVSTPTTWAKVEKIIQGKAKFEYTLHHHAERKSLYWVWNWIIDKCMLECKPVYFCNTNVDDINHPEYFKKMSTYLDENPKIKLVASPWGVTQIKGQRWPAQMERGIVTPEPKKTCGHFPMWRASLHTSPVGKFHSDMVCVGDSFFWAKIRKEYGLNSLAVHPETLGCYLSHENNLYHMSRGPKGQKGEAWDRSLMKK